ncbi:hypothetical protein [Undibacterium sp. Xuan67W]|uniref:hypothetical protein n=1 Tax=Undibacterium sp. Xuan67W TaxID=3413057 RepID=UPI003BF2EEFB
MRKRTTLLTLVVLIFGGCQFNDELIAHLSGTPLHLVSSTGSLDSINAKQEPIKDLTQVFIRDGKLRVVVRTLFYGSGSFTHPYLTVNGSSQGIVHINTKAQFGLLTKCEFFRQFEIEIPAQQWRNLKTLQIYNHDTNSPATATLQISDSTYLKKLVQDSEEKIALQDLTGVAPGC